MKHTEIRDGKRVWTQEAIETILECAYETELSEEGIYRAIKGVLIRAFDEIGITPSTNHTMNESLVFWDIKAEGWSCHVKLLKPADSSCLILIDLDKYGVEDLVYLWDNIRSSWSSKKD